MNKYTEFANYILNVPLNKIFVIVDKNEIKVNEKLYRVNEKEGLQALDKTMNKWRKVEGVYSFFIDGTVEPRIINRVSGALYTPQKRTSSIDKINLGRANVKKKVYNKLFKGQSVTSLEMAKLLQKSASTLYKWEKYEITPKAKKNERGMRFYDLEGACAFFRGILTHEWKKVPLDLEEAQEIYEFLDAKYEAQKEIKRDKNADPYAFKGDFE